MAKHQKINLAHSKFQVCAAAHCLALLVCLRHISIPCTVVARCPSRSRSIVAQRMVRFLRHHLTKTNSRILPCIERFRQNTGAMKFSSTSIFNEFRVNTGAEFSLLSTFSTSSPPHRRKILTKDNKLGVTSAANTSLSPKNQPCVNRWPFDERQMTPPNKSPEPTAVGAVSIRCRGSRRESAVAQLFSFRPHDALRYK